MVSRFGLTRRPFRLTPDPGAYVPLPVQEQTAAALVRVFRDHEAVAVLDGEPGTGKTLAGVRFLESLDFEIPRVMVNASRQMKPAELFQAILFDLGLPYQGLTEHELRLAVTGELLAVAESSRRFVLFIDEAHNLSADAIEELRTLCNVESQGEPVAFVVLAGWTPLRALVAGNRSRHLCCDQRTAAAQKSFRHCQPRRSAFEARRERAGVYAVIARHEGANR